MVETILGYNMVGNLLSEIQHKANTSDKRWSKFIRMAKFLLTDNSYIGGSELRIEQACS